MTPESQFGRTDLSTASATSPPQSRPSFEVDPTLDGLTLSRVIQAEWLKLLSLRSTWWLSAAAAALCGLFALISADSVSWLARTRDRALSEGGAEQAAGYELEVVQGGMVGILFAVILMGVLGVLAVTGEHSTGALQSSLTAVPRRGLLWSGKVVLVGVWSAATGAVCAVVVHLVLLPFAFAYDLVPSLADPAVLHIYGAGILSTMAAALIGLGIGSMLRSSAGGIVVFSVVVLVLPLLTVLFLGVTLGETVVDELWELQVINLILALSDPAAGTGPTPGAAALGLLVWVVAALLPGWLLFRVRDV